MSSRMFPDDVWEWDDPGRESEPVLRLKSPWKLGVGGFTADSAVIGELDEIKTYYRDINSNFATGRVAASNAPTWTNVAGDHGAYRFAIDDFIQTGAREMEHEWEEGSTFEVHVHWMTNGTDQTERRVRWQVSWMFANRGSVFSSPALLQSEDHIIPANTPSLTNMYTTVGTITIPTGKIEAYISTVSKRIATLEGTAPTNNPFGIAVGIHIECDSPGSRTIAGK